MKLLEQLLTRPIVAGYVDKYRDSRNAVTALDGEIEAMTARKREVDAKLPALSRAANAAAAAAEQSLSVHDYSTADAERRGALGVLENTSRVADNLEREIEALKEKRRGASGLMDDCKARIYRALREELADEYKDEHLGGSVKLVVALAELINPRSPNEIGDWILDILGVRGNWALKPEVTAIKADIDRRIAEEAGHTR